eukprot:TRINITY_DN850_c0_g1_i4.p1 TRINITY_DN850_c0_g1~~TRINITY_DN850_c0_g1_i4.p1  ORF type:complete len:303 (-),score=40.07 TRINITY_DN850_c0_g1_i4:224-1132(-)
MVFCLACKSLSAVDAMVGDQDARELFHSVQRAAVYESQWEAAQSVSDWRTSRMDEEVHGQWMRMALRLAGAASSYPELAQRTEIHTWPAIEIVIRNKSLFGSSQLSWRIKPEAVIARSHHDDFLCLYLAGIVSESKSLRGWQTGFVEGGYNTQWILEIFSAAVASAAYYQNLDKEIPQVDLRCLRGISTFVHYADASFPPTYFQELFNDPRRAPMPPTLISTGAPDHPTVMNSDQQAAIKSSRLPLGWNVLKPHDLVHFIMNTANYLLQQLRLPPPPILNDLKRLRPDKRESGVWAILRALN